MGMDQSPTRGEMFEWFMELVLKTSDTAMYRGFESLSLRHFFKTAYSLDMEKYPRGRRGSPAKGVGRDTVARVQIPASPPDLPRIPGFSGEFFSSLHFPALAGVIR